MPKGASIRAVASDTLAMYGCAFHFVESSFWFLTLGCRLAALMWFEEYPADSIKRLKFNAFGFFGVAVVLTLSNSGLIEATFDANGWLVLA